MEQIVHPYMNTLHETLKHQNKMVDCLERRLLLCRVDLASRNEYDRNEIEILSMKTQGEIDAIRKNIRMRQEYFAKFIVEFGKDAQEMEENFDTDIKKLTANKDRIKGARELLHAINWDMVHKNYEGKIDLWKNRIKPLLK